ncbi:hypothetical protein CPB84DRAFT_1804265 [Gymnopilus junonius]|uniref:VWFA domain-containing protein n=1 Tax=Gymnopilus junonius TaxID=109634 RepID=A0A9P5N994_GYMJU|nr:hypothetical protein CPB84DRAFT_1804265 [Gymnopilus junonius]
MSYTPTPTGDGKYRIKVLDQNLYVQAELVLNAGLQLCALNKSEEKQKWVINAVPGKSGVWTIKSAADNNYGVTIYKDGDRYGGYGYPLPQYAASLNWAIVEKYTDGKQYSKLKVDGETYVWDSNWGDNAVNFYYEKTSVSLGPNQCYVFEKLPNDPPPPPPSKALDVLFVQDVTGSQGPYIQKAKDNINAICQTLISSGQIAPNALRFGLVIFRDHPPQDDTTGGGDGPEAQCDAFADILTAGWNDDAEKVALLVTDSPPHGIKEDGDGFPNGCPLQHPNDPVKIGNQLARKGIVLNVLACEPTLSGYYKNALDFYKGVTKKSGGQIYPLGDVQSVVNSILAASLESFDLSAFAQSNLNKAAGFSNNEAGLSKALHDIRAQVHTFVADSYYEDNAQGDANAQAWFEAESLEEGRENIKRVVENRIKAEYRSGKAPKVKVETQPISFVQAQRAARMVMARTGY